MDSELSNDGYLKSSKININAKDASINNNKELRTNSLNVNYRGDFRINNYKESDADVFSVGNISINSRNVKQHIQRSTVGYADYLRDNKLVINNNGHFLASQLRIAGNQYDDVLITNEGVILSDKVDITANAVRSYNNNIFLVRSELDANGINGFYDHGNKKIIVSNDNVNM